MLANESDSFGSKFQKFFRKTSEFWQEKVPLTFQRSSLGTVIKNPTQFRMNSPAFERFTKTGRSETIYGRSGTVVGQTPLKGVSSLPKRGPG